MFGPKRKIIKRGWRKLHKDPYNFIRHYVLLGWSNEGWSGRWNETLIEVIVGNVEGKGPSGGIILKEVRLKSERLV
jgi:hypothetical protein